MSADKRGATPPGKPSTFDLLRWSDEPDTTQFRTPVRISATNDSKGFTSASDESYRDYAAGRPAIRTHQPAGGVSTIAFGEKLTSEEAEALLKRRPGSETKKKEMSGHNIFSDGPNGAAATPDRTGVKLVQVGGQDGTNTAQIKQSSQICFNGVGCVSPKKATTPSEVAKQRELSGSQETFEEAQPRRHQSNAKAKELVGSNIFGAPPPEVPLSSFDDNMEDKDEPDDVLNSPGRLGTPERKRVLTQKMAELSGNDIFKKDPPGTPVEKLVSNAKLKEMSGNDIFADGKAVPRDCLGGIRKPPDVVARIAQFNGTNPAFPDPKASAELMAHPKRMSGFSTPQACLHADKHISGVKIKEITGNYDLFCGQDCLDFGKTPLGAPLGGCSLAKRMELNGTESFPPSTTHLHDGVADSKVSEKYHSDVKRQEITGNYDLISFAPNRRDHADYIKYTPEKGVSVAKRKELSGSDIFGGSVEA